MSQLLFISVQLLTVQVLTPVKFGNSGLKGNCTLKP